MLRPAGHGAPATGRLLVGLMMRTRKKQHAAGASRGLDTLRLTLAQQEALLQQLDAEAESRNGSERRVYDRIRYRGAPINVLLHQPGGTAVRYEVRPHNISRGGISFLHGTFVYTDTPCDITLRRLTGAWSHIRGRVLRCRLLTGKAHEVAVNFAEPIDLAAFLPEVAAEQADAPDEFAARYVGRVLYVDSNEADQALVTFLGSELGVDMQVAVDVPHALSLTQRTPFDMVIARISAMGENAELAAVLRERGYAGALMAVVSAMDAGHADSEQAAWAKGCDCVVQAPLTAQRLAEVFDDTLPRDWQADAGLEPLFSKHWRRENMRPVILRFVTHLDQTVRELRDLLLIDDRESFQRVCYRLIESAESYGFEPIGAALRELAGQVRRGQRLAEFRPKALEVARLCAAARAVQG